MSQELNITDFESFINQSDKPIIVDFWAPWCGPCSMFGPVIDSVGQKHSSKVVVAKVNVDENMDLAMKYSVMSIPSVLVFVNGRVATTIVGAYPEAEFVEKIKQYLS
jgi:thioredoxin 1